jgi:hypothetical protein
METSKQAMAVAVDTLRSHPFLVMLSIVMLVVMPGVVKLASMLPH